MTAAHCTKDSAGVRVVLGGHDVTIDEESQQIIRSEAIFTHEDYNSFFIKRDIGLIKLASEPTINGRKQALTMRWQMMQYFWPFLIRKRSGR